MEHARILLKWKKGKKEKEFAALVHVIEKFIRSPLNSICYTYHYLYTDLSQEGGSVCLGKIPRGE